MEDVTEDSQLENMKVMVVDDEPTNRKLLEKLFQNCGYEVGMAGNGSEGYELAKSFRPALIVSDLMMPVADGIELLSMIRGDDELKDMAFILLTAKESLESKIDGLTRGADDYIPKPFDSGELLARVRTNMRESNLKEAIKSQNVVLEDALAKLKTAQSEILQREKMSSIGTLAAGVAHEINNPVGFVTSNLDTLQKYVKKILEFMAIDADIAGDPSVKDVDSVLNLMKEKRKSLGLDYVVEDIEDLLGESMDGIRRVGEIVQNLRIFAHLDEEPVKLDDVNIGLESTIKMLWPGLEHKVTLKKEYGDVPLAMANHGELNQVFMNILVNAVRSIEDKGEITIKTGNNGRQIFVAITDTGCGIPDEDRNRLFEPFFTTRDVGDGVGLGLSISYDIIKKHNGNILVDSAVGEGTTFTINIPVET